MQLLQDQAGHDRLASARVVGDQEADAGRLQHIAINGLDLVGQGIYLGDADRQLRVELVGQADAVGLDEEEEVLGIVGQGNGTLLKDLDLGQLLVGDAERFIRVVAILKDDLQQEVASAGLELDDLGRGR